MTSETPRTNAFRPTFTLTPLMVRQLIAIERTNGYLEAVRSHPDWTERLRHECLVRDALHSIQIEGNPLSFEEAFALTQGERSLDLSASEQEFVNYLNAFDAISDLRNDRNYPLHKRDLLNLHHLLVQGVRGGDRFSGRFREEDVVVGDQFADGTEVVHHRPPPWGEVEALVEELIAWLLAVRDHPSRKAFEAGQPDPWIHPVLVAGITQHRLVQIHPFVDGNGRTARLFTAMLLYQRGYDFKYLFELSAFYNRNRDAYYGALRSADRQSDYTGWLHYFVGGLANEMYNVRKRAAKCASDEDGC